MRSTLSVLSSFLTDELGNEIGATNCMAILPPNALIHCNKTGSNRRYLTTYLGALFRATIDSVHCTRFVVKRLNARLGFWFVKFS